MPDDRPPEGIPLDPIERETLRRMRAEWELALSRAELARERLERAVMLAGSARGVTGSVTIDFDKGLLITTER